MEVSPLQAASSQKVYVLISYYLRHLLPSLRSWLRMMRSPGCATTRVLTSQHILQIVLSVHPWVIHRNKDIFGPDAEVYNPERWLRDPQQAKVMDKHLIHVSVPRIPNILPAAMTKDFFPSGAQVTTCAPDATSHT